MMTPIRPSLPLWLSLTATFLMISPALPACAQASAAGHAAAQAAQPAGPEEPAPTDASGISSRAQAYYHDGLAAIYEDDALNQGRPDDVTRAIEEYKYALDDDPGSAELQNGLADLYFRAGRVDDAESTAESLIKTQPDNIPANKLLGRIYLR
ncbi:MAG: tetratricopeptide repeat protein, partial [Terracidiphilus sp.]